ncbi:S24 family peptidase [Acinetobacter corruptisaponis]|uniref:S24 family peptidase n=1 Tax=Acinetobacter corruptisaponis TaxID=3045147 RepID=A0ABY8S7K2_9GAMM|nr:S24 family peptidase [Acinetobacter sp. KCTC 92772]WHP06792.1 S24 family peptidase [Acinetobacter sp. KCTC 92772]
MTKVESKEKEIHPTIQRIYDLLDFKQGDLANAINESPQVINNWENRGISKQGALTVFEKLGLEMKWVLKGEGNPTSDKIFEPKIKNVLKIGGWVPVKSYSKMGYDGYYTEMGYGGNGGDGYVPSLTAGPNAYAVKGTGDSMYPAIRSGWYVVCDPDAIPTPTEFVEVQLKDGRRTIKEFIGVVGDILHLLAVNGEKRTTFEMDEVDSIVAITDIVPPSRHVHDYPHLEVKEAKYD